jgi:hypothetical protein
LLHESLRTKDFAREDSTQALADGATDVDSGTILAGPLDWFAAAGAIVALGRGTFLVSGPIVATLAEVAIGGSMDGLAAALVALGQPEFEAERYQLRVDNGGILLFVHCNRSSWVKKARLLLNSTGAEDISSTGESTPD